MNRAQRDRQREIREHLQILMQLGRADGRFGAAEDHRIARMRQEGIPQTQLREELQGWLAEQFQEA